MIPKKQATLVFSNYKQNNSNNRLCRVTTMKAGASLQSVLNDWVWKCPWVLNWGPQLNL